MTGSEIPDSVKSGVLAELRANFSPEFLNRVDETVIFKPLSLEEIERIVDLLLVELNQTLEERRISVTLDKAAKVWIAEKGFDPVYGARPLKRFMQRSIQTSLARAIIDGTVSEGVTVQYSLDNDELKFAVVETERE